MLSGMPIRGQPVEPNLRSGESIVWKQFAALTRGTRFPISGMLNLTEDRLIFQPNTGNRKEDMTPLEYSRHSCVRVEPFKRTWNPYNGGLRRRMRLVLSDGGDELFIVDNLDQTVEQLTAQLVSPSD